MASLPDLARGIYLQASEFSRSMGLSPAEASAKKVLGAVVEVGPEAGLGIVAAYRDGSARDSNHSGAAVVWNAPDASLWPQVEALLSCGEHIVSQIGPWEEARPDPPPAGSVRLNMLTPSGCTSDRGRWMRSVAIRWRGRWSRPRFR